MINIISSQKYKTKIRTLSNQGMRNQAVGRKKQEAKVGEKILEGSQTYGESNEQSQNINVRELNVSLGSSKNDFNWPQENVNQGYQKKNNLQTGLNKNKIIFQSSAFYKDEELNQNYFSSFPKPCFSQKLYDSDRYYRIIRSDGTLIFPYQMRYSTDEVSNSFYYLENYQFCPAFNQTFIIYGNKLNFNHKIEHVSRDGVILNQLNFDQIRISSVSMLSDRYVIFLVFEETNRNYYIIQWNLQNYQIIKHLWRNQISQTYLTKFLTFPETKLICLVEMSDLNLKITYFQFPLRSSKIQPYDMFVCRNHSIPQNYHMQKLNNHSSIIWRNLFREQEESKFFTYSLRQKNQIKCFKFDHKIFLERINSYGAYIVDIWEPKQGTFYLKIRTQVKDSKIYNSNKNNYSNLFRFVQYEKFEKQYSFLWKYELKDIEMLKFQKEERHTLQFTSGFRKIDRCRLQNRMLRLQSYNWKLPQHIPFPQFTKMPEYVFDIEKKIIVGKVNDISRHNPYNLYNEFECYPEYNSEIRLNIKKGYKQGRPAFLLKFYKIRSIFEDYKTLISHMLICLIENCHQDLIQNVLQLLQMENKDQVKWESNQ